MVDLKQQFEQYQNDSTTITFETGNTIDNFLTNCTINDYERDFDEFTKEMALFQNVDISLTKLNSSPFFKSFASIFSISKTLPGKFSILFSEV